jgi:DNA-binding transcriptional MerR regulator
MARLNQVKLAEATGIARTTIRDWIKEFRVFIPMVEEDKRIYYESDTIDVLKTIEKLKKEDKTKSEISNDLIEAGFPITVREAESEIQTAITDSDDPREKLLDTMKAMSQALGTLAQIQTQQQEFSEWKKKSETVIGEVITRQDSSEQLIQHLSEINTAAIARQESSEQLIKALLTRVESLEKEIEEARFQLEQQKKKGFFARLFGK